jgi:ribose transport system permease protein
VETEGGRRDIWKDIVANYGVVGVLIIMVVGFSLWLPDSFPTSANLKITLGSQAIPGLVALAVILPLAAGEFDLSVGATLGISSVFAAWAASHGVATPLVLILCLLIGLAVGLVNAGLVVGIGVNAFIATLGISTILAGGNTLITGGVTISSGIPKSLTHIATDKLFGFELTVFYCLALAIVLWYLMEATPFGRYLRATGLGRESARLSGVPTARWLVISFLLSGVISAFAGFLQTARVSSATPSIGPNYLLPAYAAAFLGATTIKRGIFNVWGTVIGVLLLAVGITGLTLAGAPTWVPDVFNGVALVLAVSIAVLVDNTRQAKDR